MSPSRLTSGRSRNTRCDAPPWPVAELRASAQQVGLLLLEHVIQAAERGVRVRIVVDDALFIKGKKGLADLDAHPNIEIRIFNPWASAGVARAFETAARAKKLNTRMHNKLLIADSEVAIIGGRNIADEYFGFVLFVQTFQS